jgi:hypothetical protein
MRVFIQQKIYYFVATFFLWSIALSTTVAQEGFVKEQAFFDETLELYQEWLDATQLNQVLSIQKLEVTPTKLKLSLQTKTRDDWFDLKDTYSEKFNGKIGKTLLDRFIFQMAVGKDSAIIEINSISNDYPISLSYQMGRFEHIEEEPDFSTKGMFQLKLSDLPKNQPQQAFGSVEDVKDLVKLYLSSHFDKKKSTWKKVKFSTIDNGNEVNFEISNIKKEVLDDFLIGYFELITIDMTFEQKGKMVEIGYHLQAKYGSGIFIAPRRSGYKDMEPRYQDYVERYRKLLNSMIRDVLNAAVVKN